MEQPQIGLPTMKHPHKALPTMQQPHKVHIEAGVLRVLQCREADGHRVGAGQHGFRGGQEAAARVQDCVAAVANLQTI